MDLLIGIASGLLSSVPMLGPVALLLLAAGASRRMAEGRALAAGAALSEGVHVAVVVFGLAPTLAPYHTPLAIASGVILLALALFAWRTPAPSPSAASARSPARAFALGVVLVLPHPGFLIVWLSLTTFLAEHDFRTDSALFVVGAVIGIAAWFATLLWAAQRFGASIMAKKSRFIGRALALALAAFGVWVIASSLRSP